MCPNSMEKGTKAVGLGPTESLPPVSLRLAGSDLYSF